MKVTDFIESSLFRIASGDRAVQLTGNIAVGDEFY
ncbi:Hypothetical protein BROD_1728 [Brucella sp. NF 2653]|uniref:Uncharacterized protein n=1 Tax=Brucella melitensis biotype 2 (strain ATCC 23457) TaxID=546272 RepID=C0RGC3_BRUMB|nr:Hypothetical protein BMEA_A0063 [Brucella melitensis ATCC 23457]EFM55100.1 Hypothetical protein BIBO1_3090 [Brucella inopinata BO1]EFM62258.1 Hypothetical protein BROD_1728 [Brucella sp. NF 2653]